MHTTAHQGEIISNVINQIMDMYTCSVRVYDWGNEFTQYGFSTEHKVNFCIMVRYFNDTLQTSRRNTLEIAFEFTNAVPAGLQSKYILVIPEIATLTEERHFQLMTITDDMYLDFEVINRLRNHIM